MIPALQLDGIKYTRDEIDSICQPLLDVREVLMKQGCIPHAMALSQIHALLHWLKQNTEE